MASTLTTIISNMLTLWVRTVAIMAATVSSTRFALQALGTEAFGVFAAAVGLPLILSVLKLNFRTLNPHAA